MGVFLICWVPFFCINIVAAFCKTCIPDITFKILTWLGYSNSAFNPIIYSIFNTEFREAFKRILTTHYPDWCKCRYHHVGHNRNSMDSSLQNERFVTDYGTKTLIVPTQLPPNVNVSDPYHHSSSIRRKKRDSIGGVEHGAIVTSSSKSSCDSIKQINNLTAIRINSTEFKNDQVSAI